MLSGLIRKIVRNKSKEKPGITPGFLFLRFQTGTSKYFDALFSVLLKILRYTWNQLLLWYSFQAHTGCPSIFHLVKNLRSVDTCVFQHFYDFVHSFIYIYLSSICTLCQIYRGPGQLFTSYPYSPVLLPCSSHRSHRYQIQSQLGSPFLGSVVVVQFPR